MQEKKKTSKSVAIFDRICKICGSEFKGWINAKVCPKVECQKKAKAEIDKRYYESKKVL